MKRRSVSITVTAAILIASGAGWIGQGSSVERVHAAETEICIEAVGEPAAYSAVKEKKNRAKEEVKRTVPMETAPDFLIENIEVSDPGLSGSTAFGASGGESSALPNGQAQTVPETQQNEGVPETQLSQEEWQQPGAEEGQTEPESDAAGGDQTGSGSDMTEPDQTGSESDMTEPDQTESESELVMEPQTEAQTQSEEMQESESGHTQEQEEAIYLGIDNRHRYRGMKQSFSEGYQPKVKKSVLYLAIPFTASGALKEDRLTVDLAFAQTENTPFVLKNYQKDISSKWYILQNGIMEEDADQSDPAKESLNASGALGYSSDRKQVYLYTCEVPLQESAVPGQYCVTVKAWGYTNRNEKVSLDYQIFVQIPEPKDPGKGENFGGGDTGGGGGGYSGGGGEAPEEIIRQPKLLLEESSLSGKSLLAGGQETMRVSFRNRSSSQTAHNLKVTVQTEAKSVQLGRNSFYFSEVAPGGEIELENTIKVMPLADEDRAVLSFLFEYEDKKGTQVTGTESLTVPVVQPVQVELEMGQIPADVYASDTVELPLSVMNLSRTDVYNVRLKLEGTGLFPNEDAFIGNMEAGTQGNTVMRVYVGTRTMEAIGEDPGTEDSEKYGPVTGTVTLQYEDVNGETHEITKEYQTEIKKAEVLSLKVEDEPEANSWWISVFAAVIAGLILLILILIWRLRRSGVLLKEARQSSRTDPPRQ